MDFGGWPEKSQAEYEARDKVIEAAKAFIADAPDDILVPWHDLRRAVEALQEVE